MTRKEKAKEINPEFDISLEIGLRCPEEVLPMQKPVSCEGQNCTECWNQEYKEGS